MAPDQTLKIGLVGCGGLGSRHAANVESIEGAELVAVCDHERDSAEALSGKLASQPAVYDDHRTMLSAQSPDAVLVVTPNFVHSPITVDAATAGAHVFCEKPMALTVEDCDAMIEAADNAGVFLMIGYVRRFQNAYREMKRLIDKGRIGEVRHGAYRAIGHRSTWRRGGMAIGPGEIRRAFFNAQPRTGSTHLDGWRSARSSGSDAIRRCVTQHRRGKYLYQSGIQFRRNRIPEQQPNLSRWKL